MKHYACAIPFLDGRILLGKRSPHRRAYANRWDVIGGKVEVGETVEQALAREMSEELGVTPLIYQPLASVVDRNPEARGVSTYHMVLVTSWEGGMPHMCNTEHSALEWFSIERACDLPDLALAEYRDLFRSICTCIDDGITTGS